MQHMDLLLLHQLEALIRDHYDELKITVEDEQIAKDIVDIIKYGIKHTKGPFELEGHLNTICELLGITHGYIVDREVRKEIVAEEIDGRTHVEILEGIIRTLSNRDYYCMTLLDSLRNNSEVTNEEIETLYNYFESYYTGQSTRVAYLNEVYNSRGINDHASICTYILETYDDKPIN